ncbi:hypothetical protein AB4581_08655 [Vibrio cyclitrophicus]
MKELAKAELAYRCISTLELQTLVMPPRGFTGGYSLKNQEAENTLRLMIINAKPYKSKTMGSGL